MKKILILSAFLAVANIMFAQKRDTTIVESTDKYKVETNYFGDNWFINLGGGAQMFWGDHSQQMKFKDMISPAIDFSFGKWFSPGLGVRVAANGLNLKGVSGWSDHSATEHPNVNWNNYQGFIVNAEFNEALGHWQGDVYTNTDNSYDLYKTNINYINTHIDALFNFTNIFFGYKPDRVYSFIPYIGVGWATTLNEGIYRNKLNQNVMGKKSNEISANVGMMNMFRLNEALALNLELRATYVNDRFDQQIGGRFGEGILSGTLGLTYNFPHRGWNKSKTTIIKYDESELDALRQRLREIEEANRKLQDELNAKPEVTKSVEKTILAGPLLITFPIDTWDLSNKDRVNLGFLAEAIKRNPKSTFVITGYADEGTGSVSRNEKLSRERARVVFECLTKEFGVSPSQLRTEFEGGVANMFYDDPRLSRAVITKVEE